jgi:hypothetical protein
LAIVTGGVSLVPTFTAGSFVSVTAAGAAMLAMAATTVLSGVAQQFFGPRAPKTQLSRLNVSLDPITPRKSVFGTTAMNLDLRYHESSGTDQEFIDYIIAVAAHKVASIDEIWFEEKQAWTATGGVTATYTGYLTVTTRTEGTAGNTIAINGGAKWGSSRRLTGCAYLHIRIKRTGNTKKAESPLVNGLPSRVTIIGNGALLYDPRKDSTVAGGSGSHRSNDQTTWGVYTDADDCDNPALQLLWWLLGWKINGKLSVGCGVPANRLDMASFITAANICDESVILATGGTQKRYRTSGTASDADSRMDIINTFLMSMNGTLRDNSGKLTLTVMKNDLGEYVLDLDEADMLGEFDWQQTRGLTENYNVARGRYVDPSYTSLYQMVDYPEVGFTSSDGIERATTIDLAYVEDGRRAQRIAKQILQRNQYRGMFSATFNAKALGCQVGDVVRLSIEALGWSNKPFRVISQEIRFDGQVPLALVEENAAIYAWDREDSAPVTPTAPTIYDPLNAPFILGIDQALDAALSAQATADGKIESFYQATMPTTGTEGDLWIDTDDGNKLYRHNGITFIEIQDDGINAALVAASDAQATADGKVTTFYVESTPTAEAIGDLWYKPSTGYLTRWNGSAWVDVANIGATAAQISSISTALNDAANAQATADGKIDSYYQASMPTGTIGDLWFDTDDGNKQYRHNGTTFVVVQDTAIGTAITAAAGAQATADGKVTTFASTSAPTAEGVGDLWVDTDDSNKLYRWSGSAWVSVRDAGIAAAAALANDAQATADGKVQTFYQASAPTAEGIGDLWFDTDDGNKQYRWSGSAWVVVQDAGIGIAISDAAGAQATADGKVTTFYTTSAPTAEGVGDLWFDTDDSNKLYRWSGSAWVLARDAGIAQALTDAANAQASADGKIESFYQSSMPSGASSGDLWIDTDDGNKLYRHNGTTFIEVQDDAISTAIAAASDAQATADGKVTTFVGTTAPTAEAVGDLWIDTDDNNKLYRWSGSAWVLVRDLGIAQALADVAAAQAEIDIISSDNWLSAAEKPTLKVVYDALISNYTALDAKAAALGVASTERTNATSAINSLNSFLSGLTPSWTDTTQDTPWTGATANTRFDDAHEKVAILQAAVQGLPGADGTDGTDGADGTDAITGLLTNEAVTLSADSSGVVASFTPANGTFKVFQGTTDVTTSSAFTVASSSNCTVSIGGSTGIYSVSAMSADTASATFQAVYSGVTIQKVLSLSKSRTGTDGTDGTDGVNGNKFVPIYIRSATQPATPTGNLTPAGWSQSRPAANGEPMWESRGEISGASTLVGSWSTPVQVEAITPVGVRFDVLRSGSFVVSLANSESIDVNAVSTINVGSVASSTFTLQLQVRPVGGTYSNFGTSDSDTYPVSEGGALTVSATYTNSSGGPQRYEIQALLTKTGSGTHAEDANRSWLRA